VREISFPEAIRDAQREEMRRDARVLLLGEDVSRNLLGTAAGLLEEFGPDRVMDTPISEAGFTGAAAGAAMVGMRPIVDHGIATFMYTAMDQLVSIIAKSRYLYGGQLSVPIVIRCMMAYDGSMGAQHSDRPYPLYMGVPGLKVIVPSSPYDAKGLLKAAIRDDDPVMSFEDSTLWASTGPVPEGEYLIPLGEACVKREGSDVTAVAIGGAVRHTLAVAEALAQEGISVEVIDPRSLVPLDLDTILASVRKTHRLVAIDVAHKTCSAASEISASVAEEAFDALEGPILRVATPDIQIPFSPALEKGLYPTRERIARAIRQAMRGAQ
jgi:acetoin:2,6-dichlorophenolindophenol oxidoreductase subunit beta